MSRFEQGTALIFPGQGSQHVGMAQSFYEQDDTARKMFDDVTADFDIAGLCFGGPEETLRDTKYSQATIFMASMCIAETLRQRGLDVDAVAGLSLGEFGALCFAGAFDVQTGVRLLEDRGRVMSEHIPKDSGLIVVMPLDATEVQKACDAVAAIGPCEVATYVTPTRTVITGSLDAIAAAGERCKAAGARMVTPINASHAFHSVLAQDAAREFEKVLQNYDIGQPTIPVYYNADGSTECDDIKAMEVGQLTNNVKFKTSIENMIRDGLSRFICLGPGSNLAGSIQEIARAQNAKVETLTIERYEQMIAFQESRGFSA